MARSYPHPDPGMLQPNLPPGTWLPDYPCIRSVRKEVRDAS